MTGLRAVWVEGGRVQTSEDPDRITTLFDDPEVRGWIDLPEEPTDAVSALLGRLGIHPLIVEDIYTDYPLPKIEDFDDYVYVLLHSVESTGDDVAMTEIDLLLGQRFLITHHRSSAAASDVYGECKRNAKFVEKGPAWLAHAIIDRVIDEYLPVVDGFDDEIDRIEQRILHGNLEFREVQRIFALKRQLMRLRRIALHQREILLRLSRQEFSVIPDELVPFYRDVYDHFAHFVDLTEGYRDMMQSVFEMHLSMQSNRMNEIMKVLAIVSTVLLPMTLVAGIYGMNFEHMPELKWEWGYPMALGLMLVVGGSMVGFFRAKKWL